MKFSKTIEAMRECAVEAIELDRFAREIEDDLALRWFSWMWNFVPVGRPGERPWGYTPRPRG